MHGTTYPKRENKRTRIQNKRVVSKTLELILSKEKSSKQTSHALYPPIDPRPPINPLNARQFN